MEGGVDEQRGRHLRACRQRSRELRRLRHGRSRHGRPGGVCERQRRRCVSIAEEIRGGGKCPPRGNTTTTETTSTASSADATHGAPRCAEAARSDEWGGQGGFTAFTHINNPLALKFHQQSKLHHSPKNTKNISIIRIGFYLLQTYSMMKYDQPFKLFLSFTTSLFFFSFITHTHTHTHTHTLHMFHQMV